MTEKQDKSVTVLPDGSAFAVMTSPLPTDHWLKADHANVPPMLFRMGTGEQRVIWADKIRAAAQYAIRASTMNGKESDFDPDAMVQNMIVGLLGYWTTDGTCGESWADPADIPPLYTAPPSVEELQKEVERLKAAAGRQAYKLAQYEAAERKASSDIESEFNCYCAENDITGDQYKESVFPLFEVGMRTGLAYRDQRIATLEATNAAQAEQLAKLACMLDTAANALDSGIQTTQDSYDEPPYPASKWDYEAGLLVSEIRALIQSSIPPEPQAGVELTDLSDKAIHGIWCIDDGNIFEFAHSVIKADRALNQRQAVKPLSAAQPDQT